MSPGEILGNAVSPAEAVGKLMALWSILTCGLMTAMVLAGFSAIFWRLSRLEKRLESLQKSCEAGKPQG